MPAFQDLLSGISPETGFPPDFGDLATQAYDSDFAASGAKVADLEAQLADALAQLNQQKVINYDLMARPTGIEPDPTPDEDADPDDGDADPDNPDSPDDLFKD